MVEKINQRAHKLAEQLPSMNEAELVYIIESAIALRRRIRDARNQDALLSVTPGQFVSFENKKNKYVGKVTQINKKRVSVAVVGEKPVRALHFIKLGYPVGYLVPAGMLTRIEGLPELKDDPFANVPNIEKVRLGSNKGKSRLDADEERRMQFDFDEDQRA